MELPSEAGIGWEEEGRDILKGVYSDALYLTSRNFATFQIKSELSNGRCSWDVYEYPSLLFLYAAIYCYIRCAGLGNKDRLKYIGVGFALLVQLNRAMRKPLGVDRATGTISTLLFLKS